MKCLNCGTELADKAKFCPKCGSKVEQAPVTVAPEVDSSQYKVETIWPEWKIKETPIGKGSYGVVYHAIRTDNNVVSHAAIKVISIPSDTSEVDSLRSEGLDLDGTRTYFKGIVDDFVSEIQLMESLKGIQNIVSVEDYKVVEKTDEIGWDIYIRMELLTPFNSYICDKTLTEEEVIKLGCDICTALEICGQRNIIHRDIKPENIFINDFGHFKLGDFGIARKLENVTGGLSSKGTYNYMAPEVVNSNEYDGRVDTYSLGIVLYRLLNNNKLPFLDNDKQLLSPNERKNAVDRRIRGESLPAPTNASPAMANLILRACAHNPNNRFATATQMKQALMSVANGTYVITDTELDKTTSVRQATDNYDATTAVRKAEGTAGQSNQPVVDTFGGNSKKKSGKVKKAKVIAVAVISGIVALAIALAIMFFSSSAYGVYREMNSEDFDSAVELYNDEVDGSFIQEALLNMLLKGRADEIVSDFEAEKIDYNTAISELNALEKMGFDGIKEKIEQVTASNNAADALEKADKYYADGDYENAIKEYSKIPESNENYNDAVEKISDSTKKFKEAVMLDAQETFAKKDYENAIKILSDARVTIKNDEDIETLYEEYVSTYENDCITKSQKYFNEKDYDRAISTLEHGLEVLPESKVISEKLDEVKEARPIKLVDTDVLYDGVCYKKFVSSAGESFSIGSQTYYEGFQIWDDHSLFGEGDGYALFDLQGKYSEISFDVGRTNEYEMQDVTLKVYLNDKFVEDYSLSAQSGHKSISINLAYAKNMKLEITGGSRVKYGFVNVYLKK